MSGARLASFDDMIKAISASLLAVTLGTILGGCVVHEERRCAYGWEPAHRDRYGRWIEGHCR